MIVCRGGELFLNFHGGEYSAVQKLQNVQLFTGFFYKPFADFLKRYNF